MKMRLLLLAALAALVVAGCGSNSNSASSVDDAAASSGKAIAAAAVANIAQFPKADGSKTLAQIAEDAGATQDVGMAPGAQELIAGQVNRLPFGIFTPSHDAVWGQTVVYIAKSPKSPAKGPFPAHAYTLDVPVAFRSKTATADYGALGNGIYVTHFKAFPQTGRQQILTLTKVGDKLHSTIPAPMIFERKSSTPAIGSKAPDVDTPTVASVGGPQNLDKIDTRNPHDTMHFVNLKTAIAQHRPVVLVFATPQLCVSRVCGPVTDIAGYVKSKTPRQVVFIHNEIYNDNNVNAGFRPQVRDYGLPTEPYVFLIGRDGRVVDKFEGPVSAAELQAAVDSKLLGR